MAYTNTGYARKKTITITKGSAVNTHSITASFTFGSKNYPALTDDAFAKLSVSDYETRLTAFIKHLYSLYEGLETDCPDLTINTVTYEPQMCPLS
ncbi:MAG: hypothetical protein MJZ90_11085 [Bacteroidales bacterium]|nr:hypothetical protein [Bacteroidales bacterium]